MADYQNHRPGRRRGEINDPDDQGMAVGDDVIVVWGLLRGTSGGDWMGVPPSGGSFAVPFTNVVPFKDGLMEGAGGPDSSSPS